MESNYIIHYSTPFFVVLGTHSESNSRAGAVSTLMKPKRLISHGFISITQDPWLLNKEWRQQGVFLFTKDGSRDALSASKHATYHLAEKPPESVPSHWRQNSVTASANPLREWTSDKSETRSRPVGVASVSRKEVGALARGKRGPFWESANSALSRLEGCNHFGRWVSSNGCNTVGTYDVWKWLLPSWLLKEQSLRNCGSTVRISSSYLNFITGRNHKKIIVSYRSKVFHMAARRQWILKPPR